MAFRLRQHKQFNLVFAGMEAEYCPHNALFVAVIQCYFTLSTGNFPVHQCDRYGFNSVGKENKRNRSVLVCNAGQYRPNETWVVGAEEPHGLRRTFSEFMQLCCLGGGLEQLQVVF